jgi:Ca2+-binding RTX toxin-like protein
VARGPRSWYDRREFRGTDLQGFDRVTTRFAERLESRTYFLTGYVDHAGGWGMWEQPGFPASPPPPPEPAPVYQPVGLPASDMPYVDPNASTPEVIDILGTAGDDHIIVHPTGVYVNGVNLGRPQLAANLLNAIRIDSGGGHDAIYVELDPLAAPMTSIVIFAGAGNDVIVGSAYAERIMAGDGNDVVSAGDGRDTIYGEAGADSIRGGGSSDLINGGDGFDTLRGDAGNDNIDGGASKDRLRGSLGNDRLYGGGGNDIIGGEDGDDTLGGGAGADYVDGGHGDDEIAGQGAVDSLYGGAGVDAFPDVDYEDFSDFATFDRILGNHPITEADDDWLPDARAAAAQKYGRTYSDEFHLQKPRMS